MTIPIWRTHLSRTVRRHTHLEVAELLKTGRMIDGPLTERLEQAVGSAFGRLWTVWRIQIPWPPPGRQALT